MIPRDRVRVDFVVNFGNVNSVEGNVLVARKGLWVKDHSRCNACVKDQSVSGVVGVGVNDIAKLSGIIGEGDGCNAEKKEEARVAAREKGMKTSMHDSLSLLNLATRSKM